MCKGVSLCLSVALLYVNFMYVFFCDGDSMLFVEFMRSELVTPHFNSILQNPHCAMHLPKYMSGIIIPRLQYERICE